MWGLHKAKIAPRGFKGVAKEDKLNIFNEKVPNAEKVITSGIEFCEMLLCMDTEGWQTADLAAHKKQLNGDVKAVN